MRKLGESFWHWLLTSLRKSFLAGLLVVVPIAASVLVLFWVFEKVDGLLNPTIERFFNISIPGLGFAATIVIVLIVGAIASNYLGRKAIEFGEAILKRVPIFRQLYTGAKQVLDSIAGTGAISKAAFREVVLVEFPTRGMQTVAFVTNEFLGPEGEKLFAIYVPTSPMPSSGFSGVVREQDVQRTNLSVDEALKMVISGMMIAPPAIEIHHDGQQPLLLTRHKTSHTAHKAAKKAAE